MNHTEEIALLEELLGLKDSKQLFLDDAPATNPVDDYLNQARFDQEQTRIFQSQPSILAHSSELDGEHSFLRRKANGLPLLITRGEDGQARIFLNVCRHRGTRLVDEDQGCKKRFSCPYHAWTWDNQGTFINAPHFETGFPGLKREDLGLKALPCVERHGFIWLLPDAQTDLADFLGKLDAELAWAGTDGLVVHKSDVQVRQCNWKLLPEGGLEAYHFRVAHRNTIAPLFNDNLSSYQCLGPHMRSVLPRATITQLHEQAQDSWNIREHANVLYTLFPTSMFLVQSDHVIWIGLQPLAVDQTELRLVTLKPRESAKPQEYWDANHALTIKTLSEDFDLAESMQSGMASGANEVLNFGRFEGALQRFNDTVRSYLDAASTGS